MKKLIMKIDDYINDSLRSLCGRISPESRKIVIISMCLVFAALNIFITVKSIYNIGREDAHREMIDIEIQEIIRKDSLQQKTDNLLNQLKTEAYGK